MSCPSRSPARRVFHRELPTGGHVCIQVRAAEGAPGERPRLRGEIAVDRRAVARHDGADAPPVVGFAEAGSLTEIVRVLLPIALSNTAVACLLMARDAAPGEARDPAAELRQASLHSLREARLHGRPLPH